MVAVVGGGMYLWQRGNSDSVYSLSERIDGYEREIENLKLQIASRESEETEESSDEAGHTDQREKDLLSYIPYENGIIPSWYESLSATAEITMSRIPDGWEILIHRDGFGDDAVRGDKYFLELKSQSDGSYKVTRTELLETVYWPGRD